ncbi:unnamed protein product, partial [Mesorhabditis spiculigera]
MPWEFARFVVWSLPLVLPFLIGCAAKKEKEKPLTASQVFRPKPGEVELNDPNYQTLKIVEADPFAKK